MKKSYIAVLSVVLPSALGMSAHAQDASKAPKPADTHLTEVIVTASKTGAATAQKTPIAISAFSSDQLQKSNLTNVQDLQGFVPNLSISQSTTFAEIFIRGIGSSNVAGGNDPSTTVQIDGVYLARPYAQFADFLDVERVEVLRGPQGTLYGRNAIAGTINVISRAPSDTYMAENRLTVGDYATLQDQAYVSGPLVPGKLQASLAASYINHSAYIKNIIPSGNDIFDANHGGVRGQLRFTPNDEIEATTRADYSKADEAVESYTKLLVPFSPATDSILGDYSKVALDLPQKAVTSNSGVAEDINIRLSDHLKVRSVSAYRKSSTVVDVDADATELKLTPVHQEEHQNQFSQELNLVGNFDRVDFVAGLYYLHENIQMKEAVAVVPAGIAPLYLPKITTDAKAVFVQGTYHVNSQIDVTVGGRYTWETKGIDQNFSVYLNPTGNILLNPPAGAASIIPPVVFSKNADYQAFTPKVGIQWSPNRDLMFYASATRGFKSGGYDFSGQDPATVGFSPETVWSYEAGVKSYWFDRNLRVNLTGFYYDYSNLQVLVITGPASEVISNAAAATNKGLELEIAATPVHGLELGLNLSVLDATYSTYKNAASPATLGGGLIDASGNRLNQSPPYSGNASIQYTHDLGDGGSVFGRADYSFQGRQYFEPSNSRFQSQNAYGLLNLSVGYATASKHWQIALWARNALDQQYIVGAFDAGATFSGAPGAPRTIGATFTAKY